MLKKIFSYFMLPLLLFFLNNSSGDAAPETKRSAPEGRNPGPDIVTGDVGLLSPGAAEWIEAGE